MSNVRVVHNLLDEQDFDNIRNLFYDESFPWFYNPDVVTPDENRLDNFQFTHTFYGQELVPLTPILEKLNSLSLIRVKANLLTRTHKHVEHGMHVDVHDPKITTAVYYINTNNGYTIFESGEKVYSEENTLVIFPSQMKHSGASCTNDKIRIVININFIERTDGYGT